MDFAAPLGSDATPDYDTYVRVYGNGELHIVPRKLSARSLLRGPSFLRARDWRRGM